MPTSKVEELLGFPLKPRVKKESTKLIKREWSTQHPYGKSLSKPAHALRKALLSGVTSPYLRCVCAMAITDSHIHTLLIETEENPLKQKEVVGALLRSTEQMTAFKEKGATHIMDSSLFADNLQTWAKRHHGAHFMIINVHHDYLRVFADRLVDTSPVIWEFMYKDIRRSTLQ